MLTKALPASDHQKHTDLLLSGIEQIGSFRSLFPAFPEIVSERGRGPVRRVCKDIASIVGHISQQLQLAVVDPGRPATALLGLSSTAPPEPTQVSHDT